MNNLSRNILIVEDDNAFRDALKMELEQAGHTVIPARSAEEACTVLQQHSVALVLLDWNLGIGESSKARATGAAVLRSVRKTDAFLPVVVISGDTMMDVRTDAVLEEADSFLAKPFSMSLLVSHVARWIKRREATAKRFRLHDESDVIPLEEIRVQYVREALALLNNNVSKAAEKLQVHRNTISGLIHNRQ